MVPYSLLVHAYSDVSWTPRLTQSSREPGSVLNIDGMLTRYGIPFEGAAHAWAEIVLPDGHSTCVDMELIGAGRYSVKFTANQPGVYRIRARVSGVTAAGWTFQRDGALTGVIAIGGDLPGWPAGGGSGHDLCRLIDCLLSKGVLWGRFCIS